MESINQIQGKLSRSQITHSVAGSQRDRGSHPEAGAGAQHQSYGRVRGPSAESWWRFE
ncbi:hypothetical protein FOPG_08914 [Fusarium oxysporum f. sp. conglutinans race 2 54008]|uniref:Uncharacterized protein n=1 Tax=Fusarium oxysporum f. sp. conglutinans race 2 54008 TaxID=1089457 RepID=X0IT60_FUSOX|nr:hypothetical protein FOPG_08914 [Fusarium oxysporum f. sp. conglutinans race 2 54008]KAI8404106.1 hypothetical protein FOFC_15600 [Fusarium oxysporum]